MNRRPFSIYRVNCLTMPAAVGFLLLFFLTGKAGAVPTAFEEFDYDAGTSIGGQSGGSGWPAAWATGSAGNFLATNVAMNLNYTDADGKSLVTGGGSLVVGNPNGTTATTATPNRTLSGTLGGGTNWISFLYQRLDFTPGPYLRQANLGLFEGGTERLDIGGPNTSATVSNVLSVWGSGAHNVSAPFQAAGFPINQGSTYFILVKIIADNTTAADTAYVWFNWTNLNVEPDIATATLTNAEVNLSSVGTLRFQAGNANASGHNAVFQADELHIGANFASVTPNSTGSSPPGITTQPLSQTANIGDTVDFSVSANGGVPFSYQWYFNTNTVLTNQTDSTLTLTNVQPGDAGGYFVIVTNTLGSVTSIVATLTVQPPQPPTISAQPADLNLIAGNPAIFNVAAVGYAPLCYQWYYNGTSLAGETNAALAIFSAQTNNSGTYFVVITNTVGSITSRVATLNAIYVGPAGLPAFPGADGAAKFVTGGRGGLVYHVTHLDTSYTDATAGGLRYGLTDANFPTGVPRTIVFDVAGVFWLGQAGTQYDNGWDTQSRYNVSTNVTLAGQTAPGPVILMGGTIHASGNNIIIRNIVCAAGYGMKGFHEPPAPPNPGDTPHLYVYDALDADGQNVMVDHCTTIYGTDETISCNERANNFTFQYCDIAQGQNFPQADAENPGVYTGHALGSLLQAGSNCKISAINNLYAHLKGRLPRVGTEATALTIPGIGAINDFRNNVFYNWLNTAGTGASGQVSANNFINNFYLAGPGGDDASGTNIVSSAGGTGIFNGSDATATKAFVSGNLKDINKNGDPNDFLSADGNFITLAPQSTAYNLNIGVTLSASNAFQNVLNYVGARWWERPYSYALGNTNAIVTNDVAIYIDERLIHETATGTGKIMAWADDPFNSDPTEGVEWRSLLALRADPVTGAAPYSRAANWDTDGDGMPDWWEIEHGLDPNVANPNGDFDHDGYTDLEEYLNEIAAWPAPGDIMFTGVYDRYAEIFNWQVSGVTINIGGSNVVTSSNWQPSRHDTAIISNATAVVDAVGQNAGILRLTDSATLLITNGWLNVANRLEIGADCLVQSSAGLRVTNSIVNNGTFRLTGGATLYVGETFTNNGTLDLLTWNGMLPGNFVNNGTVLDHSLLVLSSSGLNGADFHTTIQGYAGHNYQLQFCDTLTSSTWQNVGSPIVGSDAPITFIHAGGATAQQGFYRVLVTP
jgi:hypothetical protein